MGKNVPKYGVAVCLLMFLSIVCVKTYAQAASQVSRDRSTSSADAEIPAAQLLQAEELMQLLRTSGEKPLILQVGSHVLYAEAHIPGSSMPAPEARMRDSRRCEIG